MSGFAAAWLALREPYDAQARNPQVREAALAALAGRASVTIVDLGCGTGATLRALAPRLPMPQLWRLVDNDLGLIARAVDTPRPPQCALTAMPLDLARDLEAALDGAVDLVTASALLDLVSAEWLERLVVETVVRSVPLYAALSYDGRVGFRPADPADAAVLAAVNRHQRRDKGFGPALGPEAARRAIARFEALGYAVTHAQADWVFGPTDRAIQDALLAGWAKAARETGVLSLTETAGWLARRRMALSAGRSAIRVGHIDLFARPTATRRAERSQSSSSSSPI